MKILWGTKAGEPEWHEQIITEVEDRIPAARAWALANGFDRLREAEFDPNAAPDFSKAMR